MFTFNTLVKIKCVEGKLGTISQVFELIVAQEKLSLEVDELRIALVTREAEITHLKEGNQQLSSEGPSATQALKIKNAEL